MSAPTPESARRAVQRWILRALELATTDADSIVDTAGPFQLWCSRLQPDTPDFNLAVPVRPIGGQEDIAALLAAFRRHRRRPVVEAIAEADPALEAELLSAGFEAGPARPLMSCDAQSFRPVAGSIPVRFLSPASPEEDLSAFLSIRWNEDSAVLIPPEPAAIERFRAQLTRGRNIFALAVVNGTPAGTAVLNPLDGVGEMVGVVTRPDLRGLGVAAAVCSAVLARFFAEGGSLVWLDAANATAQRLYHRLGFQDIGNYVNYEVHSPGFLHGTRRCPCCRFWTLARPASFEICPVCFWEDDGQEEADADVVRGGPNGRLSLTQARANYQAFGACGLRFREHVRPPLPEERAAGGIG